MPGDLFKLVNGSRIVFSSDALPDFGRGARFPQYHFVEDDQAAALLASKERGGERMFDRVTGERLDDVLGSAEAAVEAIEAGEVDNILDFVLFAEREEYGPRVTVIEAIEARNQAIIEQRKADPDDDGVKGTDPDDIVTA